MKIDVEKNHNNVIVMYGIYLSNQSSIVLKLVKKKK